MSTSTINVQNWKLCYIENKEVKTKNLNLSSIKAITTSGYSIIEASVPGNFELDLMREKIIDDLYFGTNIINAQKLENLHVYYFSEFELTKNDNADSYLVFYGIDTVAEIFVDGEKIGFVENMFHKHEFCINNLACGKHEIVVHILPSALYAQSFDIPSSCKSMKYNADTTVIRKAPYMFGWDIMPRIVTAGIHKPVIIEQRPKNRIEHPFTLTTELHPKSAVISTRLRLHSSEDFITNFSILFTARCKDQTVTQSYKPFTSNVILDVRIPSPYLWWPKNYGEHNLYDIEIVLFYNGVECDRVSYKTGIRTVALKRTSLYRDGGDFCFIINGRRVYAMGTNWVPTDSFPSRHSQYDMRGLQMLDDVNCNMVRCWGGNVYPEDHFYEFCDEHGIMVWQDFSMACAHYGDNERICSLMEAEAECIVKKFRNHPSLIVWSGDNECDQQIDRKFGYKHENEDPSAIDPNDNKLTREVIYRVLRNHDTSRPYLPSSPYIDHEAFLKGLPAENHLWGPRDFFKGEYYMKSECFFASEMGYQGCPSPASLIKFLPYESLNAFGSDKECKNADWLAHAVCVEPYWGAVYSYRVPLTVRHVVKLFGNYDKDVRVFAKQSQISQAEALKFFIEHFRIAKPIKTGLLWWNIIDGWPQLSDAIVDWYGCKKLAYHYIKRSQQPFCMMFDEPKNGKITLVATNDLQESQHVSYTVTNVQDDKVILTGEIDVDANGIVRLDSIVPANNAFYLIKWTANGVECTNHFTANIENSLDYHTYLAQIEKVGYNQFEGFEE